MYVEINRHVTLYFSTNVHDSCTASSDHSDVTIPMECPGNLLSYRLFAKCLILIYSPGSEVEFVAISLL